MNAHNPPGNDRATRDYELTCFVGDQRVLSIPGQFAFSTKPDWVTLNLAGEKCDRLRIDVKTVWHNGGGIAEVEVK
jgi:hypothetical protein